MADFVNWDFLEREIGKFKKEAAQERMLPLDQVDLTQMVDPARQPGESAEPGSNESEEMGSQIGVGPGEDEQEGDVAFIEIKNEKGRIKKINPHDFVVVIDGGDHSLSENLRTYASGIYLDILNRHGAMNALQCIMKDLNSEVAHDSRLSFQQAKMILTSLASAAGGRIPDASLRDVLVKTASGDRKKVAAWLDDTGRSVCHSQQT